jgi:alkylation response protein AidB-like acyl-CoA dehydrogenase
MAHLPRERSLLVSTGAVQETGDPVEGLIDRVRAVVPRIAERARVAEQRRQPDDDAIEALKATGVFRAFVPRRFGRSSTIDALRGYTGRIIAKI